MSKSWNILCINMNLVNVQISCKYIVIIHLKRHRSLVLTTPMGRAVVENGTKGDAEWVYIDHCGVIIRFFNVMVGESVSERPLCAYLFVPRYEILSSLFESVYHSGGMELDTQRRLIAKTGLLSWDQMKLWFIQCGTNKHKAIIGILK